MKPLTAEWAEKAEGDYRVASAQCQSMDPVWDAICYHAEQCVEKYLKAWLVEQGVDFPKMHDLERLGKLCAPSLPEIEELMDNLRYLTSFGVDIRYPGMSAVKEDAETCLQVSVAVRDVIVSALNNRCKCCIDGSEAQ